MNSRRHDDERGYNPSPPPPTFKKSSFSRPLLPLNSSLLHHGQKREERKEGSTHRYSLSLNPSPLNSVSLRHHAITAVTSPSISPPTTATTWHYRECQRNHAAGVGGHVVDGCCEFMLSDDVTLKCAACGCHRSFHRKEPGSTSNPNNDKATQTQRGVTPSMDQSSSEDMQISPNPNKKRARTKFTSEQKDKMVEFADRLSWKFQKPDEVAINEFCNEAGVSRQVFKVWMHNNKYTYDKKQSSNMKGLHQDNTHQKSS